MSKRDETQLQAYHTNQYSASNPSPISSLYLSAPDLHLCREVQWWNLKGRALWGKCTSSMQLPTPSFPMLHSVWFSNLGSPHLLILSFNLTSKESKEAKKPSTPWSHDKCSNVASSAGKKAYLALTVLSSWYLCCVESVPVRGHGISKL